LAVSTQISFNDAVNLFEIFKLPALNPQYNVQ